MASNVRTLQPPLTPRNGHTLEILMPCRVSNPGPGKQDIRSNDDQRALLEEWLKQNTEYPYNITVLAGSGSGECLERAEYLRLIEMVESDRYDLVPTEDLGRIVRRIHAHLFCEHCIDHKTRLISLNDCIDTAVDGWQDRSIFSAWHHERSNRDTSQRIKRTLRNRFTQGGCTACLPYGYFKKAGAKSDADVEKLPEAEGVYKEWFRRLDNGAGYAEVADWLNENGVPVGPHCRNKEWHCAMVGQVTHNWILKGLRFRNKRRSKRYNKSGKYITEKADSNELLTRKVSHLAFFEEAYYDRIVAKVDARNAKYRRNGRGGPDPLKNRPRKRVRAPGQMIYDGICGRMFVFGGHGQKDHLMCDGARQHKCWNGITVDGPLAAKKIANAVLDEIETLSDFEPTFLSLINEEARRVDSSREKQLREVGQKLESVEREISNVIKFIRAGDESSAVREDLKRLEQDRLQLNFQQQELENIPSNKLVIPPAKEIRQMAREAFNCDLIESYEFANRLRAVTGKIHVWPFRSIDGGHIVLRAKFRLTLASLLSEKRLRDVLQTPLERIVTLDLFEPTQRIRHREQIMEIRKNSTEREASVAVGITSTAAQHAARLDRLMQQHGISDPYVLVTKPPADYSMLRRHKHRRYNFEPLTGHPLEWK